MHTSLTFALFALAATPTVSPGLTLACGDVSEHSVVVWVQTDAAGPVEIEVDRDPAFSAPQTFRLNVDASTDFAGQRSIQGLRPGSRYHLRARAGAASAAGRCATAPAAEAAVRVRFLVGGDLGGQGWCRDPLEGYRIFDSMEKRHPDFFIANGDMIYADGSCPAIAAEGQRNLPGGFPGVSDPGVAWTDAAALRRIFFAHWRYNRADSKVRAFLSSTPIFAQWDDHEVGNDFGAAWPASPREPARAGFPILVAEGRSAFVAANPLRTGAAGGRLYRRQRWGRELELFVVDGRSHRAPNDQVDGPQKTLLGAEQKAWLVAGLRTSTATFKVVSFNVPLSVPTGSRADRYGRDGFANGTDDDFSSRTGFEHELLEILSSLERARVRNLVVVATDVHLAASLRHRIDLDGDGQAFVFYELISGPLRAGRRATLPQLDPTLSPVILFSEGNLFNFGEVEIVPARDASSTLLYTVRDQDGQVRPGSRLELRAEPSTPPP